jgi:hypothetical protein
VSSLIVSTPLLEDRAKVISRVIEVEQHLRSLNSFNSLMALTTSLNSNYVQKLKATWALVDEGLARVTIAATLSTKRIRATKSFPISWGMSPITKKLSTAPLCHVCPSC